MDAEKILHVWQERGLRPKPQHKGDKPDPALFNVNYENWLDTVLKVNRVEYLAYELPIPARQIASHADVHEMANYMKRHAEGVCAKLGIGFVGVHIQSWRSSFLGRTQAPKAPEPPEHILPHRKMEWQKKWRKDSWKDLAIQRCAALGIDLKSHDAAEAVGICAYLHKQMYPHSWLCEKDLLTGDMSQRIDGPLSLRGKVSLRKKMPKTKTEIMAEAESLFRK